jgi:hypothetical protein
MNYPIVDPEPHSTRNPKDAWGYVPRWLRIVLFVITAGVLLLIAVLMR